MPSAPAASAAAAARIAAAPTVASASSRDPPPANAARASSTPIASRRADARGPSSAERGSPGRAHDAARLPRPCEEKCDGVLHIVYPSLIADPRGPGRLTTAPVCSHHVLHASRPRIALVAALIALVALTALAGAPSATAASSLSCAEQIVDDWYGDGRVDKIYPLKCYQAAIRSLPVDVLDYSRAEEDILRALQFARAGEPDPGPTGGAEPNDNDPGDGHAEHRRRRRHERPRRSGRRRRGRGERRHVRPVVRADPPDRARRARAAPARRRRGRLSQPPRAGAPPGRPARPARPGLARRSPDRVSTASRAGITQDARVPPRRRPALTRLARDRRTARVRRVSGRPARSG